MQSAILTSAENIGKLKEKRAQRDAHKAKKEANAAKKRRLSVTEEPPKKKTAKGKPAEEKPAKGKVKKRPIKQERKSSSSSDDEGCIVCLKPLPRRLTRDNSIKCNTCKEVAHLKCADVKRSWWTCKDCKFESEDFDESED